MYNLLSTSFLLSIAKVFKWGGIAKYDKVCCRNVSLLFSFPELSNEPTVLCVLIKSSTSELKSPTFKISLKNKSSPSCFLSINQICCVFPQVTAALPPSPSFLKIVSGKLLG